jgi:ATP-dependent protease HslVU (ClpYQ) peptidase subunit
MTTIIAVQGPGWAVVGSDSRITDEGRIYTMSKGYGKIVANDEYLFGAAGDMRAINILEHTFTPPDASGLYGRELDAFITNDFVPALRKCFEDHGYADRTLGPETKEAASQGSMILVVVNGTIYELGEDYAWVKDATGLYGMGTGGDYAIGALYAYLPAKGKLTVDTAKEIVKESLAIGAKLDSGSGGPFTVLAQLKDE